MALLSAHDKTSCPRCSKQVEYDYLYVCRVPPGCGRHACYMCWRQGEDPCPFCGAQVLGRCYTDENPHKFRKA
jgi:hypothetical protein